MSFFSINWCAPACRPPLRAFEPFATLRLALRRQLLGARGKVDLLAQLDELPVELRQLRVGQLLDVACLLLHETASSRRATSACSSLACTSEDALSFASSCSSWCTRSSDSCKRAASPRWSEGPRAGTSQSQQILAAEVRLALCHRRCRRLKPLLLERLHFSSSARACATTSLSFFCRSSAAARAGWSS